MPLETLAEAGPGPAGSTASYPAAGLHPLLTLPVSAVLLWAAFPPIDWYGAAWVALVPLFLLIPSSRTRFSIYSSAWIGGMLFWLLSIQWVRLTDPDAWLAWIVMALALSFWWPAFVFLGRLAVRRLGVPLMVAAPVLWIGLEYVRAHILTGFPWYYLAHTQHAILPLIQISDFAGSLGVSFLIALANAWLVDVRTQPLLRPGTGWRFTRPQWTRLAIVVTLLVLCVAYGEFRILTATFHDGPRVALLQSNIEQRRKNPHESEMVLAVYKSLIERAFRQSEKLDLIVWPETSFPYPFVVRDPALGAAAFERVARNFNPKLDSRYWSDWERASSMLLRTWVNQIRVPMLVGSTIYDFRPDGVSKFNSAIYIDPVAETIQRYAKVHLVPFGEYVPLIELFPWLIRLTPYHGSYVPTLSFGPGPAWITMGRYRVATAICFEDTVPQAVRRFFRPHEGGRSPDLLVNLSNDGWFHGSSEHDVHLAASVFRAVENRVPLVRAVNTGISALIDGNGRVLASIPKVTEGVLTVVVPLDDRVSLYSAWGDWLGIACLALTAGIVPFALVRRVLGRNPNPSPAKPPQH